MIKSDNPESSTTEFAYAVLDLAICGELRARVSGLPPSVAQPLFDRNLAWELLQVGPWIVRLSKAPDIETTLTGFGNSKAWGYNLYSTFDILSLRQSLRKLNLVRIPTAENPVLFRYWDPRVMTVFLDVASDRQREAHFALIDRIGIGDRVYDVSLC